MLEDTRFHGDTCIHRLDPRARLLACAALTALVAVARQPAATGSALAIAAVLAGMARLPLVPTLKRLAAVNVFMALVIATLPLSIPGTALFEVGPAAFSREGLVRAIEITLKANAIVLYITALLATVEVPRLGHALGRLRLPRKLVQLFMFMVRYSHLLQREHARLASAMRVRCFRARLSRHALRSLGYLIGMLLVRSFDRSQRTLAAMKCRGFQGRYYALDDLALGRRDVVFSAACALALLALGWAEWA